MTEDPLKRNKYILSTTRANGLKRGSVTDENGVLLFSIVVPGVMSFQQNLVDANGRTLGGLVPGAEKGVDLYDGSGNKIGIVNGIMPERYFIGVNKDPDHFILANPTGTQLALATSDYVALNFTISLPDGKTIIATVAAGQPPSKPQQQGGGFLHSLETNLIEAQTTHYHITVAENQPLPPLLLLEAIYAIVIMGQAQANIIGAHPY